MLVYESPGAAIHHGDCLDILRDDLGSFDCIFADPPDNIGLGYDEHDDSECECDYVQFLSRCVRSFTHHAPIVWLSFNARWTFQLGQIVNEFLANTGDAWTARACVQVFTFGQHRQTDLGNNHRPLWRIARKDARLYPDAIRVPSWRQRNGDKRADARGRVPGDVFDMQYPIYGPRAYRVAYMAGDEEVEEVVGGDQVYCGDVFDFPRVTGNSKQRCDWHPTQLHEQLVERCLLLSTAPGDKILDPFGGTGTTLRVCRRIGRDCTLIDKSRNYCDRIAASDMESRACSSVV